MRFIKEKERKDLEESEGDESESVRESESASSPQGTCRSSLESSLGSKDTSLLQPAETGPFGAQVGQVMLPKQ